MDYSRFSDKDFNVKDWINKALGANKDDSMPIDAHASNIVMKLQLFIQEVNKSLEETSEVALNNMPKVLREVDSLKTEALVLKEQMQIVKDDIRRVEENTSRSMKDLVEIDSIKTRMIDASEALKEADNWATLSSSVEDVLQAGDIQLLVLQNVPDFSDKVAYLESLKDKVEALLSTKLVVAFNGHLSDEASQYIRLFTEIDRLPHLQTYYNRCHKTTLVNNWNSMRRDSEMNMPQKLSSFTDTMLTLWHQEISWCSQVFPDPISVLCTLFKQTLNSLEPSIAESLSAELKNDNCKQLDVLIYSQEACNNFLISLESAIKSHGVRGIPGQPHPGLMLLADDLKSVFASHLLMYSVYQEKNLQAGLKEITMISDDANDTVSAMSDSVDKVFELVEKAKSSCHRFTLSLGTKDLMRTVDSFLSSYINQLEHTLSQLRTQCLIDEIGLSTDGLEAVDQWTNFQHGFTIIDVVGHVMERFSEFQDDLVQDVLVNLSSSLDDSQPKPITYHNYFLPAARESEYSDLIELHHSLANDEANVLKGIPTRIGHLNEEAQRFAFDAIFIHLKRHLTKMPYLEVWRSSSSKSEALTTDLPLFSLSPQSYITQVGDYLLMLPQQLEPFFAHDSKHLKMALSSIMIPYVTEINADGDDDHYDHIWLTGFAKGTMELIQASILLIPEVTTHSTKQLLADLDYFCNVLEALETTLSKDLQDTKILLEASFESFHDVAEKHRVEPKLETALAKIRRV